MFPKNLSFYVNPILSTFTAKIGSQILQTHLGQKGSPPLPLNRIPKLTHPRSYPFIMWQVDI